MGESVELLRLGRVARRRSDTRAASASLLRLFASVGWLPVPRKRALIGVWWPIADMILFRWMYLRPVYPNLGV